MSTSRFHQRALEAYSSAGWRLYPCAPGEKRPLLKDYLNNATADIDQLMAWRHKWPDANFGVCTGRASGIVALDVDAPYGMSALRALESAFAPILRDDSVVQATPNGGWHIIFRAPERPLPSKPKLLGNGLEFRAERASILLAPSVIAGSEYGFYAWTVHDAAKLIVNPPPLPSWIANLVEQADAMRPAAQVARHAGAFASKGLAAWLSQQKEGNRNAALYWCAKRMAEGGAGINVAITELSGVAESIGLSPAEIDATIRSAYR